MEGERDGDWLTTCWFMIWWCIEPTFFVSWLRMITFRLVLPLFVLSLPFLSRAKSTTTAKKKRNIQKEDKENFGLWRREKHKNNDSFKLAVDDVAVVVCCAHCGAFKAARHVIFGKRNCSAEGSRNHLIFYSRRCELKAPPERWNFLRECWKLSRTSTRFIAFEDQR